MFILINNISNINSESYIEYKMKRYTFIGGTFNLSIETVRKIFQGLLATRTIIGLLKDFDISISPNNLYFLVRNKRLSFITLRIFPYLKLGKYHKRKHREDKYWITRKLYERF